MHRRALLMTAVSLAVGGCATWTSKPVHELSFQPIVDDAGSPNRSKPKLTVTFLPIDGDPDHVAAIDQLWHSADIGPIDAQTRRRWRANGCRLAVLPTGESVDRIFRQLPISDDPHQRLVATADIRDDSAGTRQRISMPIGKSHQIVAGQPIAGSHTVLCNFDGRLVARRLDAAQTMFVATLLTMVGPDAMRLRFEPTVQFGQSQRKFVSSEAAIRIDSDRPAWTLDPLAIDWDAMPGETLLIGPSDHRRDEVGGLAGDFLAPAGRPMIIALTAEAT